MVKRFWGLIITLIVFGGIFALLSASYAMTKAEKPAVFGCDPKTVIVQKSGNHWIIEWRYDRRLEGTQVKINLYRNGKLLRTIAENVTIGKNGRGSWRGNWDEFFYTVSDGTVKSDGKTKSFSSPDWWVSNIDDPTVIRGKEKGVINKSYQIEIISMANSDLRVMDECSWDWGN